MQTPVNIEQPVWRARPEKKKGKAVRHSTASKTVTFTIPVRTHSKLNQRTHWSVKAKQSRAERTATLIACFDAMVQPIGYKTVVVTFTRVGPRKLDDDNLAGALKAVRDELAKHLGVDDGSEQVIWVYKQAIGKPYAVEVKIEEAVPVRIVVDQ